MSVVAHYLWFRKQETVLRCATADLLIEFKAMDKINLKSIGVLLLLAGAFFSSCTENEEAWFPVTGRGKVKTETRRPGSFTKVKSQINGNVIIKPGYCETSVSAQENLLPLLETEVVNGTLYISFGSHVIETDSTVIVKISSPEVQELTFSGSGSVVSNLGIPSINLPGNGDITCIGETEHVSVRLSGTGVINLNEMTSRKAQVKITGNGNVSLHVTDNLDVTIQGFGVVYYSGTPQIQQNISGNGKIVEQN